MVKRNILRTPQSRVFTIENRAGPANAPIYEALGRALGVSWDQGDVTPVRIPSPDEYGKFITIDQITGQQGLPGMSLEIRMSRDLSRFLALTRKGCPLDVQVHVGKCKNPQDFNAGWETIFVLEGARITNYGTGELGALDSGEDAVVNETVPLVGDDYYQIMRVTGAEIGATEIAQEIVAVAICDSKTCGECGIASDGCQKIFALTKTAGGSPGLAAEIIFSEDQGATLGDTNISTLAANEEPDDMACVGTNLAVVSEDSESVHYAAIADILDGAETWAEVTGFTAAKGPRAIFSLGRVLTWMAGAGGYIYFSSDITAAPEIQSAGGVTIQDLNDIHGVDELNLVTVGGSNAVAVTSNGGNTWTGVTGPAVGVALNAVWMRSETEWFVGTAGGQLWYTRDGGESWTQKRFTGDNAGAVTSIKFSTPTVGYMTHTLASVGYVLRTIDGGNSWYRLPEETGITLPDNDGFNDIAVCGENPNFALVGGLGANAVDGSLVKIA